MKKAIFFGLILGMFLSPVAYAQEMSPAAKQKLIESLQLQIKLLTEQIAKIVAQNQEKLSLERSVAEDGMKEKLFKEEMAGLKAELRIEMSQVMEGKQDVEMVGLQGGLSDSSYRIKVEAARQKKLRYLLTEIAKIDKKIANWRQELAARESQFKMDQVVAFNSTIQGKAAKLDYTPDLYREKQEQYKNYCPSSVSQATENCQVIKAYLDLHQTEFANYERSQQMIREEYLRRMGQI